MNILGHIFGNVKLQYIKQDFRTVYIEQDIYNGVNMVLVIFFMCDV